MVVLFLNSSIHLCSDQILIGRQNEKNGIGTSVMGKIAEKE